MVNYVSETVALGRAKLFVDDPELADDLGIRRHGGEAAFVDGGRLCTVAPQAVTQPVDKPALFLERQLGDLSLESG